MLSNVKCMENFISRMSGFLITTCFVIVLMVMCLTAIPMPSEVGPNHAHEMKDRGCKDDEFFNCQLVRTFFCGGEWMKKACRKKCSLCHTTDDHAKVCEKDHKDCGMYGEKLCGMNWGKKNCQIQCGLCA